MSKRELNNGPLIRDEKETVSKMIALYCHKKHHQDDLCEECADLKNYCLERLSYCRFGEQKSACSNCSVHCYQPKYREKIKRVMRYSGMWMLLYHPVYSVKHLLKR
ncbi:nitrous oxide-stimulated promoter family protein [Thermoactinomyces mirandus]|uniref:Nitrous oxide-stimulated promoter family protein n=1 Tax=Thermoactinomyces mirandus TaxID=2756294 RepID=A0A7W1XU18_9BACL|nr:nitrous oxide-stimulated promoter family protein [Thermoactinomyces mirandus]MBA4603236.1 nitrous oxide-stimulated promoter family protein [Thermoactinomyces mirandus]